MSKKESSRLSNNVFPSNYSISIEPSRDMTSYLGSVKIKAYIKKPTKNIILHSKNSDIKTTTICVGNQCLLPKLTENKESETINLEVKNKIKGDIEIHIEFNGIITEDLAGIYRSRYENKGKTEHLITTQCEAPYARKIFPCFDEPDKKAAFEISVIIDKDLKAISNMPEESEKSEGNKKRIKFKVTPKMSSYLFYLGIGNFEFANDNYKKVKLRIVTTPGKTKNARFALECTKKYLQYFEDYSKISYPLEKLDLIAIPDFSAGAMENWGAITFRELLLLVDEKNTSANIKKRSAEVIAHELWHQWSGNLVTMKWWNDLWLNESFATYMAYKAVDNFNPEWKIWEDYLSGELASGLFKDSLKTTHPIGVEVNNPKEIEEIFDEISYAKGGCVLRMLENYMGKEQFREGVSNYLKNNSYSNAKASDLWDSLNKIGKSKNVKNLMEYWISHPGYPLINVEKTKNGIKITQERFNNKKSQIWPVPIIMNNSETNYNKLLDKKQEIYKIQGDNLKVNSGQFGFYRTKYSNELLTNLGNLIKEKRLNEQDRWGVLNDLWALCTIGKESLENYLMFLDNYLEEENYTILADISSSIKKLDRLFYYEQWWPTIKQKIIKKILSIYKNRLKKLGWNQKPKESVEEMLMRNLCISFCGFASDEETIKEAKEIYLKKEVDLDIASSIYNIIAQNGGKDEFDKMLQKYEEEKDIERKIKLLSSLCLFKKTDLLKEILDISITDKVRVQNLRYVFSTVLGNPAAQKVIYKWAKDKWNKLKNYQEIHYIFQDFLDALIISQVNQNSKDEVKNFVNKNVKEYEMTKANAFEICDMNIKFIEKNKDFLKNY